MIQKDKGKVGWRMGGSYVQILGAPRRSQVYMNKDVISTLSIRRFAALVRDAESYSVVHRPLKALGTDLWEE